MKPIALLIALSLPWPMPVNADIYRCDEGGRVVYQSTPCAGGGSVVKVQKQEKPGSELPEFMRATDTEMTEWRKNHTWKVAMDLKLVLVGMPEKIVYVLWGLPDHTNTTTTQYGSRSQLVYRRPHRRGDSYVYIEGGKVVATQN